MHRMLSYLHACVPYSFDCVGELSFRLQGLVGINVCLFGTKWVKLFSGPMWTVIPSV